jgi:hypothetical protein
MNDDTMDGRLPLDIREGDWGVESPGGRRNSGPLSRLVRREPARAEREQGYATGASRREQEGGEICDRVFLVM